MALPRPPRGAGKGLNGGPGTGARRRPSWVGGGGWERAGAALPHQLDGGGACESAVLDRINAGADRGGDSGVGMGVGGDLEAEAMGGVADRLHLGVGEGLAEALVALAQDAAGGVELDDVG